MNVYRIYDDYSSEDYLCNKTKPKDYASYVCSYCSCAIKEEDLSLAQCNNCGEFSFNVEKV